MELPRVIPRGQQPDDVATGGPGLRGDARRFAGRREGGECGRRFDRGQELVPVVVERYIQTPLDCVVHTRAWLNRLGPQVQVRFSDTLAALAMIAGPASRDNILPDVKPPS